jgi:hypothetical protein
MIPWERIERIERGTPPPVSAPATPRAPAPASNDTAWVHVVSERSVTLERRGASDEADDWRPVCSGPCDMELSLRAEYRIAGRGLRKSAPFELEARPGERIEIDVKVGTTGGLVGGIILVSTGPVVGLIGLALVAVANADQQTAQSLGQTSQDGTAKGVGVVLGIGGLAMTLGGILMIVNNGHTHLSQEPLRAGPPENDAWLRLPTFREDRTKAALPQTFDVPLFHTTF